MKYIRNNNLLALAIAVMMVVMSTTTAAALSLAPSNAYAASDDQESAASEKDRFVSNHHDHTIISENGIQSNEGSVTNEEDSHFNFNDNTNREDRIKCNSHSIPANTGDEGNIPCF